MIKINLMKHYSKKNNKLYTGAICCRCAAKSDPISSCMYDQTNCCR
ncbi:unnamed protein product [Brugia timori]|uniref:Clo7bot family Cys-rich peptide n=1 Tax=Brugia timori TaxID=42155 RepID=A0A0R3QGY1_9BILA|nr:unnamed protein product [Brugia timori]